MPDFETKYNELLNATAAFLKLDSDLKRCNDGATRRAKDKAKDKMKAIVHAELGKAIQLQQAMKF